jgi:hypothetical protein
VLSALIVGALLILIAALVVTLARIEPAPERQARHIGPPRDTGTTQMPAQARPPVPDRD